jgi:hypothetical protein
MSNEFWTAAAISIFSALAVEGRHKSGGHADRGPGNQSVVTRLWRHARTALVDPCKVLLGCGSRNRIITLILRHSAGVDVRRSGYELFASGMAPRDIGLNIVLSNPS